MADVYHMGVLSSGRKAGVLLVYYPSGRGRWYSFSFDPFWIKENDRKKNYLMSVLSKVKYCCSGNNHGYTLCLLV